jgi:DNA-binding response OmpR family regulator
MISCYSNKCLAYQALQNENKRLYQEIERLNKKLRELTELPNSEYLIFKSNLHLTTRQVNLLILLFNSKSFITLNYIAFNLYPEVQTLNPQTKHATLIVTICQLRSILAAQVKEACITSKRGVGYVLTDNCRQFLCDLLSTEIK